MNNSSYLNSQMYIVEDDPVDILPGYLALTCFGLTILLGLASYGGFLIYKHKIIIPNNNDNNQFVHNMVYEDF